MESKLSISYSKKIFGKMYATLTRQVALQLKPKNRFKLTIQLSRAARGNKCETLTALRIRKFYAPDISSSVNSSSSDPSEMNFCTICRTNVLSESTPPSSAYRNSGPRIPISVHWMLFLELKLFHEFGDQIPLQFRN